MINKSVVLSTLVPKCGDDISVLRDALEILKKTVIKGIEIYTPLKNAKEVGRVIRDYGFTHIVYPISGVQKNEGYSLCTKDEKRRNEAVDLILRALDTSRQIGAEKLLISSGCYEGDDGVDFLYKSIEKIMRESSGVDVVLEPGDRNVDSKQLLGPTSLSVDFALEVRKSYKNFYLTLDVSHILQLGEDVSSSLKMGKKVSNHMHLATCILKKGHPLYGDKHPHFSSEDVVYTNEKLLETYKEIISLVKDEDLLLGCEIIDRTGERMGGLERAIKDSPWFFTPLSY